MKKLRKIICIIFIAIISLFVCSLSVKAATNLKVTVDTLNLRKAASTNSNVLTLLSKGDTCELIEEDGDWYKVKYKTYTGYVSKQYVEKETSDENTQSGEDKSNKDDELTSDYTEITGKISKKTDVKILPLINSSVISNLNKDTSVTIVSELNGWAYVQTNSIAGWIREDSIKDKQTKTVTLAATSNTDNKDTTQSSEDNETSDSETSDDTNNDNNTSANNEKYTEKTMYVNDSYVNLRKEPSTSSSVIMVVALNTKLTVIGESGDWYKVSTSSGEAYVSKKLLSDNRVTSSRSGGVRETNTDTEDTQKTTGETSTEVTTVSKTTTTTNTNTKSTTSTTTASTTTNNTTSSESKTSTQTSSSLKGEDIVAYAKKFLGVPYVYGGASASGFDCSGFTMYVYKNFGISMKHGAQAQAKLGKAVNADKTSSSSLKNNLQPGDLVFFLDYETMDEIGHCGIYIGDGNFIHASSGSGYCVKINSLLPGEYYNTRYCAARRII